MVLQGSIEIEVLGFIVSLTGLGRAADDPLIPRIPVGLSLRQIPLIFSLLFFLSLLLLPTRAAVLLFLRPACSLGEIVLAVAVRVFREEV